MAARNADEPWRSLWRKAGTGDVPAAKKLVRAMERAGLGIKILEKPLGQDEIDNMTAKAHVKVSVGDLASAEEFADDGPSDDGFSNLLISKVIGGPEVGANGRLYSWRVVDTDEDGNVIFDVTVTDVYFDDEDTDDD